MSLRGFGGGTEDLDQAVRVAVGVEAQAEREGRALAGGAEEGKQPVLLSTTPDPANQARNILLADGEWRESALAYERAFHLFDGARLEEARLAWKLLSGREGVERSYWAQVDGRWTKKG